MASLQTDVYPYSGAAAFFGHVGVAIALGFASTLFPLGYSL